MTQATYLALVQAWGVLQGGKPSPVAHTVKNLPAQQETQVRSLGQEDPLEKGMATHCSVLGWRIPWTEEPGYSPWGRKESDTTEQLTLSWITTVSSASRLLHPFPITGLPLKN